MPIDSIGHSQYSAVCSIKGSYGPQNLQVSIVLKASKYAGAKDLQVSAPAAHVRTNAFPELMRGLQKYASKLNLIEVPER